MNLLITGGAGFIGSHVVRYFVKNYPNYNIYNLDCLSYAGNLDNLSDIKDYKNYYFLKENIKDGSKLEIIFKKYKFKGIIHLAAESHVDRSISDPNEFVLTNIVGTVNLLNSFKKYSMNIEGSRFYHISTDEVYGSLGDTGLFSENSPYDPRSPYSASKASSDHFVRAYGETYNLPYVISNCSNNYGEFQFPEKLIPLFIKKIIERDNLTVYGDGNYIRDWLYVKDHVKAIDLIFHKGKVNETYNVGGLNEWKNIDLVKVLCKRMDMKLGRKIGSSEKLIKFVKDRPGHDKRYAIDSSKITKDLGWKPEHDFENGLSLTIDWYIKNQEWLNNIISGKYLNNTK